MTAADDADPFAEDDPVSADDPFADAPDSLLVAIPGEDPAGEDLRYDPVYDRIQEARREEDTTTPQGIWTTKLKRAEWAVVRDEAMAALRERSKDLQLAGWLLEAWLQMEGLPGLVRGLDLMTELSTRFWIDIHPKIQEDDPETRLAPFYWMESRLPERVGQVLITGRHGPDDAALSWASMNAAQRLETMATASAPEYKIAVSKGALTLAAFTAAVRATPTVFYERLSADAQSAVEALQRLAATLDGWCGPDSPTLSALERSIQEVGRFARRTLADRGVVATTASRTVAAPPPAMHEAKQPGPAPVTPAALPSDVTITSRDHAYALLAEIAQWLAVQEPHSPTPYLIRRAIAWGGMGLNELLGELIDEDASRRTIQRLLQMPEA